MANKIDSVVDAVAAGFAAMLAARTLKALHRGVINPLKINNPPVLAMAVSRLSRDDDTWTADVLIQLAANKGGATSDETITELIAAVDAAIEAVASGGAAGGVIDKADWDMWYQDNGAGPLAHVGAIGGIRIRVEDPLAIS